MPVEHHELIEESPLPHYHLTSQETPYERGWTEQHHVEHEYVPERIVHSVPVHHHWTEERHHAVEPVAAHERHVAEYHHGDEHKLRHELDLYKQFGP